jgi:hypothetical protein
MICLLSHLHDCTTLSQGQGNTLLVFKCDSPDGLALCNQFPNEVSGLEIPDLDSTITAATHDSSIVKLQTSNAVVVGCETMDGTHLFQRPNPDRSIRSTSHQGVSAHLQLAN